MFQAQRLFQISLLLALGMMTACRATEPTSSAPAAPDRASDEAAIHAQVTASQDAINRRDFAAFVTQFAPEGDAIVIDSARATGHEPIRRLFETGWAAAPAERKISLTVESIRFLGPDVAVVENSAEFSAGEPAQDRATAVMVRRNGVWQTAALRVMPAAKK